MRFLNENKITSIIFKLSETICLSVNKKISNLGTNVHQYVQALGSGTIQNSCDNKIPEQN